jgi:ribosomal protein S18 acetylase RimI-like enzyme
VAVRHAKREDAARIAEIHVRSWQSAYRGLIPQDYLDGLDPAAGIGRWAEAIEQIDPARGGVLVVVGAAGQVAGFANFCASRDEDAGADDGEVRAIYLSPECWGLGHGRMLMAATLEYLAAIAYAKVTLWVLDSNTRARRFYEAAGFRPDGAVKVDDSHGFALRELRYRRQLP